MHPTGSPEAPAGPLAVPLRAVQRLDRRGHHGRRGVVGLDGGVRGVLRPAARAAVRRGDAGVARRRRRSTLIEFHGGRCHLVDDPATIYDEARRLAARDAAGTTWTSSPTPSGPPTGAATTTSPSRSSSSWPRSGTRCRPGSWSAPAPAAPRRRSAASSATAAIDTRLCVVDPENSAFFEGWSDRRPRRTRPGRGSRIEGIGRPAGRAVVHPAVVDAMIAVPDAASIAAMRLVQRGDSAGRSAARPARRCGARCGWSPRCARRASAGSVVTLLCDGGERYAATYYDDGWLAAQGLDIAPYSRTLEQVLRHRRPGSNRHSAWPVDPLVSSRRRLRA